MIKIENPKKDKFQELSQRPAIDNSELDSTVKTILADVRARGDEALYQYTQRFDGVRLRCLAAEQKAPQISQELMAAIDIAVSNITAFHAAELSNALERNKKRYCETETQFGVMCWRKSVAISPVGLYIPAGSAPLFSTVLMLGIPAKLAGCDEIVLCSSPDKAGNIAPEILYCAQLLGIKKIYSVGGAQAIAAMAYGTATIPAVAKIFGPGNQYVTAAKKLVLGDGVGIDMLAGPSELLVIADATANPVFVAADLLSQAEHGADSQVVLLSDDASLIDQVLSAIELQLKTLPRREIAQVALSASKAILFADLDQAMEFANTYAPEHLIIATKNCEQLAERVCNAGSVFLGNFTPESAGDYASGTNHVLPTARNARHSGGVSVASFLKDISFQQITEPGLIALGPTIMTLADAEHLEAHKCAVSLRLSKGGANV